MSDNMQRAGRGALYGAAAGLALWFLAGQGDMAKLWVTIIPCSAFLALLWVVKD